MGRGRVLGAFASALLGAGLIAAGGANAEPADPRSTAEASIVNGDPVPIASLPWMAVIEHRGSEGRGQCTGTVVAPRAVLTAGHCVLNFSAGGLKLASGYRVLTGVADVRRKADGQVSRVTRALIFPGYGIDSPEADAGLLILAGPVAAPALPLAGPAEASLYTPGTRLLTAGWGLTDPEAFIPSDVLRSTEAIVQAEVRCRRRAADIGGPFWGEAELCALSPKDRPSSACSGDSGGPAIARRADGSQVQVGIISHGHGLCAVRYPQFFTRVDHVSAWVAEWIAAVESGAPAPPIEIPKVHLPRMTSLDARDLVAEALIEDFGLRFFLGREYGARCRRVDRESMKCAVHWDLNRFDYYGSVTVFYKLFAEGLAADYRYRIHRVNERCRQERGARCPVHTRIR